MQCGKMYKWPECSFTATETARHDESQKVTKLPAVESICDMNVCVMVQSIRYSVYIFFIVVH